jgi:hypothetical protein
MTRAEIRSKTQVLLDEYADQGGWTPEELDHIIDLAHNAVAALFLRIDDSYYISTHDFSLSPSVELYALPTGCVKIKRIVDANGTPVTRLYRLTNRCDYVGTGYTKTYYFQGNQIGFLDIPTVAATYPCLYIRRPTVLVNDDSVPDVPEYLGHDLIVVEAAITALAMDEEINSTLEDRARTLRGDIRTLYYTRNADFSRQADSDEALDDLDL